MRNKARYILLLITILSASCSQRTIYSEYKDVPVSGWAADTVLSYSFEIENADADYDVLIYFRHTQRYRYQNVWLFVEQSSVVADSLAEVVLCPIETDTIEFFLADERGRWLGNGYGNIREMPVLYMEKVRFPHPGQYNYSIEQGMREEVLQGVSSVGLKVVKSDGKK